MQNILSFVPTTNAAPVTPNASEAAKSESGDGSFSESFFSMILGQYAKDEEETTQNALTLPVTVKEEETPELATAQGEAKSIDEHLLGDLLSIINALQKDPQTTTFPTLKSSSTLEKLVASETTRQEFANVKSVSDLMNLSQKYNLGLEKLSVSKESMQSLKTQFPSLDQGDFFKDLQTALDTASQETTPLKTNAIHFLEKQASAPVPQNAAPTPSILGELIAKNSTPKESNTTSQTANNQPVETTTASIFEEKPLIVDDKQRTAQALQEETTQEPTKPLESALQKVVNSNETKKTQPSTQKESTSTTPLIDETPAQTTPALKVSDGKAKEEKTDKNESADTLLKAAKSDKISDEVPEGEIAQSQKAVNRDDEKSTSSTDETRSTIEVKGDVKTAPLKQDLTAKTTTPKESLSQFASDLQEKIEAYKPPIMKVELSLSPKSLGDVDVTLLTRGNNLHVNISSTTTTMNLFTKNQDDVRSALVNMGFTNLEMNFSDQSNKEQAQQNQKNSRGDISEFTTEQAEEETTTLEIVIPQYV